jgi:hypothetical protein
MYSCQLATQIESTNQIGARKLTKSVPRIPKETKDKPKGMANPIMLSAAGGADIGRLFNAYYRTGQQSKMFPLLDGQTKKSFSKEKVLQLLINLDYGYDMKLSGATNEGPHYTLTYTCQIAQTKVVKQLKVVVENDTARIIPSAILNGKIFN